MASFAGTYFTSWEYAPGDYQLGPIVVVGDDSVTVDGVAISGLAAFNGVVWWSAGSGNPSSAMLIFASSSNLGGTTFIGSYSPADSPATGYNLYGFATQPSQPLAAWNDTYTCYDISGGTMNAVGELVINSPDVTFLGQAIANPVYTGLNANGVDTAELAWFTTDGNQNNVALSLFSESDAQLFSGAWWSAGSNRPEGSPSVVSNLYGTTQSGDQAAIVYVAAYDAQAVVNAAINVATRVEADAGNPAAYEAGAENAGDDAAGDAAGNAAGDLEHQAVDDAAADAGEAAGDDLLEAAIGGVVDRASQQAETSGHRMSAQASGLSARALLGLKTPLVKGA